MLNFLTARLREQFARLAEKTGMCGITGFVGKGSSEELQSMAATLKHRGPDDEGYFFVPGKIGLGFRRLSIIDLKTGNQPIFNEDKTVAVIFNGEIYNYRELRKDLEARHRFITQTDTEVIVHLYEEIGEKMFEKLNGMFAVALWDMRKNKLILARDRFGKKPLYYAKIRETLIFGSELKAVLKHPLVNRELDFESLNLYLTHEAVPSPRSMFKNIFKVEPASFLVFENGSLRSSLYYNHEEGFRRGLCANTMEESLHEFDAKFREAVKMRLVSDVPLGLFLSGGIDSSMVCWYAQELSRRPMDSFSIGFADDDFNEMSDARIIASSIGTTHHEKMLSSGEAKDSIMELGRQLDEPVADTGIYLIHSVSKFARQSVSVALSGSGGDELFMGYQTFQANKFASYANAIPRSIRRRIIRPFVDRMPASFGKVSNDYKMKRFFLGLEYAPEYRDSIWVGAFTPEEKQELYAPHIRQQLSSVNDFSAVDRIISNAKDLPFLDQVSLVYQKLYMMENLLPYFDRASMAVSLEVRSPLLDYHIVDFANSLPAKFKMRGLTGKYFLRKLMEKRLPASILRAKKRGGNIPIARWLKEDLKDMLLDVLSRRRIEQDGIFQYDPIKRLIDEHLRGKRDNRKSLWALIAFHFWKDNWLK